MISKCSKYTNDIVKSILNIAACIGLLLLMYDFNLSSNKNGSLRRLLLYDVGDEVGDGIHIGSEEDEVRLQHHERRRLKCCGLGAPMIILFSVLNDIEVEVLCLGEEFAT